MMNVVVGKRGHAHAVLIRAAEPLDGWEADLSGPGKLAQAMAITRSDNGRDVVQGPITFWRESGKRCRIVRSPRIGVDYAKHWKDALLRYCDRNSFALSKRR
jgi:DNA-3-methyladenine glycosylase